MLTELSIILGNIQDSRAVLDRIRREMPPTADANLMSEHLTCLACILEISELGTSAVLEKAKLYESIEITFTTPPPDGAHGS